MQLEDYFEFEPEIDRIRVKGTRISVEHLILDYLEGDSPEIIAHNYHPTLSLEQAHATVTYSLRNRKDIDAYLQRTRAADDAAYQEHLKLEPPDVVKRIQNLDARIS